MPDTTETSMILIILSAFQGRLMSEPMEWPRAEPNIVMSLSPARFKAGYEMGMNIVGMPITRKVRFEHTGRYQVIAGNKTAAIYEMVDF